MHEFHDRIGGGDQVLIMGHHHHGAAVTVGKIGEQRDDPQQGSP